MALSPAMGRKALFAIGLTLALVAISASVLGQGSEAASGSTDVTFYGHVFDITTLGPNPANTEPPIGETILGLGSGATCVNDFPTQTPAAPLVGDVESCEDQEGTKLVLFSTAGPVDVQSRAEFLQGGAYAQLHNERGQTKPVMLDTSGTISANVFGAWDTHGWYVGNAYGTNCLYPHPGGVPCLYPYWGWDPGVFENVVMEATLYHADLGERSDASNPPPVDETLAQGDATEIASGQWGPDQVINGLPGYPNAVQFPVDLGAPQVDQIPRSDDFFLVFQTYQDASAAHGCVNCPMRWWTGEFFPPTFQMPVDNPFAVERVVPNFANQKLAVLGIINTPWGSYDVAADSVDLAIEGPRGSVGADSIDRYADFSVAHGGHFEPVNLTWIWDYNADDAPPGEYEVTVSASNVQGSASAQCTASFTLRETDGGSLRPGEDEPGRCGIQGVQTDEALQEAQEDANRSSTE